MEQDLVMRILSLYVDTGAKQAEASLKKLSGITDAVNTSLQKRGTFDFASKLNTDLQNLDSRLSGKKIAANIIEADRAAKKAAADMQKSLTNPINILNKQLEEMGFKGYLGFKDMGKAADSLGWSINKDNMAVNRFTDQVTTVDKMMASVKKETRKMSFEFLQLIFAGMALKQVFGGVLTSVFNTYKTAREGNSAFLASTNKLGASWEFLKFVIASALESSFFISIVEGISGVIDMISSLFGYAPSLTGGIFIGFAAIATALGSALMAVGMYKQIKDGITIFKELFGSFDTKGATGSLDTINTALKTSNESALTFYNNLGKIGKWTAILGVVWELGEFATGKQSLSKGLNDIGSWFTLAGFIKGVGAFGAARAGGAGIGAALGAGAASGGWLLVAGIVLSIVNWDWVFEKLGQINDWLGDVTGATEKGKKAAEDFRKQLGTTTTDPMTMEQKIVSTTVGDIEAAGGMDQWMAQNQKIQETDDSINELINDYEKVRVLELINSTSLETLNNFNLKLGETISKLGGMNETLGLNQLFKDLKTNIEVLNTFLVENFIVTLNNEVVALNNTATALRDAAAAQREYNAAKRGEE